MSPRERRRSPTRGVLELLIGATIISFSPILVRLADVGPSAAGFYRGAFGAAALGIYLAVRGEIRWAGWRPLLYAAACGALFAADLSLWHRAIGFIGPGLATILANFQALILAGFGIAVLRERPDWRFLSSVPLALLGLFLLVGISWSVLPQSSRTGVLFALATALCYASYLLVFKRMQSRPSSWTPSMSLAAISVATALFLGIETISRGEGFQIPNRQSWAALLGYGIICQALGWIIISHALTRVAASRAGLILLLQPALSFVWDMVWFDRPTGWVELIGAALVLAAIYLGSTRPPARMPAS